MSSFHTLNVVGAPTRSDEEGWAQQTSPNPASSSSLSPRLRRALVVLLGGSLIFAAVFASGLAVLRSSSERERERGGGGGRGPHPVRPFSEASPLGAAGRGGGSSPLSSSSSSSSSTSPPPPPLRFLVLGDWGRRGNRAQREVAAAMTQRVREVREAAAAAASRAGSEPSPAPLASAASGRRARAFHPRFLAAGGPGGGPEFVLTVGDNFYGSGLLSAEDPAFDESFVDVYSSPELVGDEVFDFLILFSRSVFPSRRRRLVFAPLPPLSFKYSPFFLSPPSFDRRSRGWECSATTTTARSSPPSPRRRNRKR